MGMVDVVQVVAALSLAVAAEAVRRGLHQRQRLHRLQPRAKFRMIWMVRVMDRYLILATRLIKHALMAGYWRSAMALEETQLEAHIVERIRR
jgi:hypothetical protein